MPKGMEAEAQAALVGRTIAQKYVVEKFLGGGAMGAVFRAKQTALEKVVAVKVMHAELAKDPSFAVRFHREAKAASRLDHPSSMRVVDFGEEPDGLLYIVMEYREGRDLLKVIHEDWPLSEARIVDILSQALAALAVAHDMGVIHRDLKPENIMVLAGKNDEGREVDVVKVCDFGIAKLVDAEAEAEADPAPANAAPRAKAPKSTTQGLVIGTPEYMSPEQAQGKKLDSRSDIYSMGIILYQLLTGRVPFDGESAVTVVVKHVTEAPTPPRDVFSGVNPRLETVCLKAIEKSPDARFSSAREMRVALRAALEGAPLPAPQTGSAPTEPALVPVAFAPTAAMPAPAAPTLDALATSGTVAAAPAVVTAPAVIAVASPGPAPRRTSPALVAAIAVGAAALFAAAGFGFARSTTKGSDTVALTVDPAPSDKAPVPPSPPSMVPSAVTAPSPLPSGEISPSPSGHTITKVTKPEGKPTDPKPTDPKPGAGDTVVPAPPEPKPAEPPPTAPPPATTQAPTSPPTAAPPPTPKKCAVGQVSSRAEGGITRSDMTGIPAAGSFAACAAQLSSEAKVAIRVGFDDSGRRRGAPQVSGAGAAGPCFSAAVSGVGVRKTADLTGAPVAVIDVQVACP